MKKFIINSYNFYLIIISLLFTWFNSTFSYEYCNKNYTGRICNTGETHMCCEGDIKQRYYQNKVEMESTIDGHMYPANALFRKLFIQYHNEIRDLFASGVTVSTKSNKPYPKAARMRTLLWDTELEYLAQWNVWEAHAMIHDFCHGTDKFPSAGQNLAAYAALPLVHGPLWKNVNSTMWAMFDEKDLIDDAPAVPGEMLPEYLESGHFTQIVHDRQGFFGCGLAFHFNCTMRDPVDRTTPGPLKDTGHYWGCYYWACNFETSNLVHQPVYSVAKGEAGDNCTANWNVGRDKQYPHLCENPGKVFRQYAVGVDTYLDFRFVPPETFGFHTWY